jgi:pimeloyl-ACP methyl ester carboxylesterase
VPTVTNRIQLPVSPETLVRANGVNLCVQTFGYLADPAILLIGGASASMLWWEEPFCERLAAGGRFVIRYDHRDTGRSVSYEPGAPPYSINDLAADALGLLDILGIARAHLVGISMGGGLVQIAANTAPDRVASLTLVATSPGDPDLPPPSQEFRDHVNGLAHPDWSDHAAVINYVVNLMRVYAGPTHPIDEPAVRALVTRDVERARSIPATMINHFAMQIDAPGPEHEHPVAHPTLVIHGTEDPIFALPHAHAMVRKYPGAQLLTFEGVGHELPRTSWDVAVPAILRHTSA